uniref:Uncharacterized protein n=1 Tax=Panagrolaimus sp. ES5 TaxID=591445 RepID=A0AC34G1U4_9BILA
MPEIDESDMVAAALAEKLDREKSDPSSTFSYFPAFLRFNRINKSGNNPGGRIPVCFCCRAFVCHHQRCPCSKFIF